MMATPGQRQILIGAARRGLIVWSPQGWRPKAPLLPPLIPPWPDLIEILISEGILIHPRDVYPSAAFRPLSVDESRIHGKLTVTYVPTQGARHE
jgi:hypothetical protein